MLKILYRCLSIRPPIKPHPDQKGVRSVTRNIPEAKQKPKPWQTQGIFKDEFFMRKYNNISPQEKDKLREKVDRQRRARNERYNNEASGFRRRTQTPSFAKAFRNPLSEYVYGTHPVLSALTANKRGGFNRLYTSKNKTEKLHDILRLCKKYGIKVIDDYGKQQLDQLTENGVHNGVVLETKKLVVPQVEHLGKSDGENYLLGVYNDLYNTVVETSHPVARKAGGHPLGIYLDGITDPQNAGAIFRSAYYLGVDFIVVPEHATARLGPAANKASAGALDLMNVFSTDQPLDFVEKTKKNGWVVVSTDARPSEDDLKDTKLKHRDSLSSKYVELSELSTFLETAPVLLVFGSEGEGIRTNMKMRSDYLVGLEKGRDDDIVDSLNVSVAAGLLIGKCLG